MIEFLNTSIPGPKLVATFMFHVFCGGSILVKKSRFQKFF